jgi:hypothetical protein
VVILGVPILELHLPLLLKVMLWILWQMLAICYVVLYEVAHLLEKVQLGTVLRLGISLGIHVGRQ